MDKKVIGILALGLANQIYSNCRSGNCSYQDGYREQVVYVQVPRNRFEHRESFDDYRHQEINQGGYDSHFREHSTLGIFRGRPQKLEKSNFDRKIESDYSNNKTQNLPKGFLKLPDKKDSSNSNDLEYRVEVDSPFNVSEPSYNNISNQIHRPTARLESQEPIYQTQFRDRREISSCSTGSCNINSKIFRQPDYRSMPENIYERDFRRESRPQFGTCPNRRNDANVLQKAGRGIRNAGRGIRKALGNFKFW